MASIGFRFGRSHPEIRREITRRFEPPRADHRGPVLIARCSVLQRGESCVDEVRAIGLGSAEIGHMGRDYPGVLHDEVGACGFGHGGTAEIRAAVFALVRPLVRCPSPVHQALRMFRVCHTLRLPSELAKAGGGPQALKRASERLPKGQPLEVSRRATPLSPLNTSLA